MAHDRERQRTILEFNEIIGSRAGRRHGLSDEEKKNTSENLEFHLELGDQTNVETVLIGFFFR